MFERSVHPIVFGLAWIATMILGFFFVFLALFAGKIGGKKVPKWVSA